MENDKILKLLEAADWKDISLRLIRHAFWRANHYTWRPGKSDQLLGGKTPEDIACEAIKKVLNGARDWDPDKYPDLLKHLMWVVNSDMEHLYSSMEHKKTGNLPKSKPDNDSPADFSEVPSDPSSPVHAYSPTPEEDLVTREDKDLEEKLKKKLYDLVMGDEDLEILLLCFEEGIDKPEIIAAETGWDVSKVYNLKRKLLRKAKKLNKIFLQGD